jgi:serine/threonine protein kinase
MGNNDEISYLPEFDNYKPVKKIGKGGQADVFLAKHVKTGEKAVLKLFLPEPGKGFDVQYFLREIKHQSMLQHPHIVKILEAGKVSGMIYCILEYCNSGSLEDLVKSLGRRMEPEETFNLMRQLLTALEYAHDQGFVHRDIKPENLLLHFHDGMYELKIADFGLSKFDGGTASLTTTGDIGGSLAFMCRQQLINYKYARPAVDVWSAAAVMYYLLTLQLPRSSNGDNFSPINMLDMDPVPIRKARPDLPEALANLLDQALDDSEFLYFRSAADFRKALKEVLKIK